jgi:hypothetical protein
MVTAMAAISTSRRNAFAAFGTVRSCQHRNPHGRVAGAGRDVGPVFTIRSPPLPSNARTGQRYRSVPAGTVEQNVPEQVTLGQRLDHGHRGDIWPIPSDSCVEE